MKKFAAILFVLTAMLTNVAIANDSHCDKEHDKEHCH